MKCVLDIPEEEIAHIDVDELLREIESYLDAIALFRRLGHEPSWLSEEPWPHG